MMAGSAPSLRRRGPHSPGRRPSAQRGVVLMVALVVMFIMVLAAASMMRSVSSTTLVAGNLAFQQAAVSSGDRGVETAVAWLENNNGLASSSSADVCASGSSVLACDQLARGYLATRTDPTGTATWATLWNTLVSAGAQPVSTGSDAAGNTASYLVQRLCSAAGDPSTGVCALPPASAECGQSHSAGAEGPGCTTQVYYRITVRTVGPRNTVSFIQSIVAL